MGCGSTGADGDAQAPVDPAQHEKRLPGFPDNLFEACYSGW